MKSRLILAFVLILSISAIGNAQDCSCESNFEWVKKTFEENDAEFQYIIDSKGQQAYDFHNVLFIEKVKVAKNYGECTKLLYEWLTFFRLGHIGIELIKQIEYTNPSTGIQQSLNIGKWDTVDIDTEKFSDYLNSKKETDFEGIWESKPYTIGIKKEGDSYIGFITESEIEEWKRGEVKLKIIRNGENLKSTYYMKDRSAREENNAVELIGTNYLQIGNTLLKRLQPQLPAEPSVESYFKSMSAQNTYAEEIGPTTLLLRIPSFDYYAKAEIDSVIFANKEKILRTKNLIIDLRNNGGGSDANFSEIIPFLYTNPIRTVGVAYLSTKQNNQRMLDFASGTLYNFDEETKKWAKDGYSKLEAHLGEFVDLNPTIVVNERDTVHAYPKNIGIIINGKNASTTEQFLLVAKQSKKVKLFGTTTFGALDISNMYSVESPCKEFKLWYCLSKSHRIPDMAIDNRGIQPDYYLDKAIPQHKWVGFVKEVLDR